METTPFIENLSLDTAQLPPIKEAIFDLNICLLLFPVVEEFCNKYEKPDVLTQLNERMSLLQSWFRKDTQRETIREAIDNSEGCFFQDDLTVPDIEAAITDAFSVICLQGMRLAISYKEPTRGNGVLRFGYLVHLCFGWSMYGSSSPKNPNFNTEIAAEPTFQEVMKALELAYNSAKNGEILTDKDTPRLTDASFKKHPSNCYPMDQTESNEVSDSQLPPEDLTTSQKSVFEALKTYIQDNGAIPSHWYAGVATDPQTELFEGHKVNSDGLFSCLPTYEEVSSRAIEKALLNWGCKGESKGGGENPIWVYVYLIEQD